MKAAVEEDVIQASPIFLPPNEEDTDVSDEDQIEGDSGRTLVGKATHGLFREDAANIKEGEEELESEGNNNDGSNINLEEDYLEVMTKVTMTAMTYQTADQLKPPSIDVLAKLASILLDLGYISEALTLMTDLKNRPSSVKGQHFESSYKAWYCMLTWLLQVRYECIRWNSGHQSNDNYMVQRWG